MTAVLHDRPPTPGRIAAIAVTVTMLASLGTPVAAFAWCTKQTTLTGIASRFPGHLGPDRVVRVDLGQSIQQAIDSASDSNGDGYIIVAAVNGGNGEPYGETFQRVVVDRSFPLPFGLVGCSLTLRDPRPEDRQATARITAAAAPADIFVMDLHGSDSQIAGWLLEGNGRTLRNAYGNHNAIGQIIVGNGNTLRNGQSQDNGSVGILVLGSNNTISDMRVAANGNSGAVVIGDRNLLKKNLLGDRNRGNARSGAIVLGKGNVIEENKAFANRGDGVAVQGGAAASPTVLRKNSIGDRGGKGNLKNGIVILAGEGNGGLAPVEVDGNIVRANGGAGIRIADGTTRHELKNNSSGGSGTDYDNAGCEYEVASGNLNATGNKANGVTIQGQDGSPFPSGCTGTP